MKVTTSAAMRARDVSRPHAEHLASAEAAEASAASSRPAGPAGPAVPAGPPVPAVPVDVPGPANAADADAPAGDELLREAGSEDRPGGARRRWRPRGSGRGRAPR